MTTSTQVAVGAPGAARRGHHPGLALAVIAASQLMVVLDATIVNVALPTIQTALKFSYTNLTWVLERLHADVRWAAAPRWSCR